MIRQADTESTAFRRPAAKLSRVNTHAIATTAALLALGLGCQRAAARDDKADAATTAGPTGALKATLVISASTAGQLVPCGCSPDQKGGLPRAVALVKKLRAEGAALAYIDAGDLLFEGPPSEVGRGQAELKAKVLAQGDEVLDAVARVVGARDLARGAEFVSQSAGGTPLLEAGGLPVQGARGSLVVKVGLLPVGLFAAGLGELKQDALAKTAAQLREQGARVVVLLFQPKAGGLAGWSQGEALLSTARAAGVDLVVLGHRDDPASDPNQLEAGPPALLAVEGHGQSLLRIDLTVPADAAPGAPLFLARGEAGRREALTHFDERIARLKGQAEAAASPERKQLYLEKIKEQEKLRADAESAKEEAPKGAIVAKATFLPIDGKAGEDAGAKKLVDAYDDNAAAINLAAARRQPEVCPAAAAGEASYIGISDKLPSGESCAACHKTQAAFWSKTNHAHAYATLVKVKKEFSLDCIRCHVTGWQQPGGVCRIDKAAVGGPGFKSHGGLFGAGRQDVQCESCHGPASEHVKDPPGHIDDKVGKATCIRCHEAANSPHFDFAKYLPGVVGPGHGAPLAKGQEPGPRWPGEQAEKGKP